MAQTNQIVLSGALINNERVSVVHLKNMDGVNISIPVTKQNNFSLVTDSLTKGFFQIDQIGTIYLNTGYQLTIKPDNKQTYIFKGIGASENNAFRNAKNQLSDFFPLANKGTFARDLGELAQESYYIDPPIFLQKIDSFKEKGILLFDKSEDSFFKKYAAADLDFYAKHLLSLYVTFFGMDLKKMEVMPDKIRKLDRKAPDYLKQLLSITRLPQTKIMDIKQRQKLTDLAITKWDKNDEPLFKHSIFYREAFEKFFQHMSYSKYFSLLSKTTSADIKSLTVARGEITNPFILSYFDYTITSSILSKAKDTALLNKYYNEYITRASRKDYITEINKIYNNAISFSDNMPAPSFSYKNVAGKSISLESLRGKYVYIDVWATWCVPCKAEIPHLKLLEETYRNKNLEFVSISVDEQKNVNKWKKFTRENGLMGTQLMTDDAFESPFIKKMSINSIPRFILIDPDGKLISANALRPSDNELKILLNKLL